LSITTPNARPSHHEQHIAAARLSQVLQVDEGLRDLLGVVASTVSLMEIAEAEIEFAQFRHGEQPVARDESGKVISPKRHLWRSFRLLRPTGVMGDRAEFVYRSHCIQILDRVAAGEDTRQATDAEMVLALAETSLAAPLKASAAGLYMRLFARAFPDQAEQIWGDLDRAVEDYERLYRSQIDEDEAFLRRKTWQDWRDCAYLDTEDD
jgi:hypothetical protein